MVRQADGKLLAVYTERLAAVQLVLALERGRARVEEGDSERRPVERAVAVKRGPSTATVGSSMELADKVKARIARRVAESKRRAEKRRKLRELEARRRLRGERR